MMVLRQAVDQFLEAFDQGDAATVACIYDPDFLNIRVADDGGFSELTGEQILWILEASEGGNHSSTATDTVIHHIEVIGDSGHVLLTRMRNDGKGLEPVFYSLVWRKKGERWLLLREFIHQKSFPHLR